MSLAFREGGGAAPLMKRTNGRVQMKIGWEKKTEHMVRAHSSQT